MSEAITTIDVQGKLPKVASGKVRDLFAVDDNTLLFVASDRISAYDVIMENVSLNMIAELLHSVTVFRMGLKVAMLTYL